MGYKGIKETGIILKARRHSRHGDGVYFNSRLADNFNITKRDIADENYLGGKSKGLYY